VFLFACVAITLATSSLPAGEPEEIRSSYAFRPPWQGSFIAHPDAVFHGEGAAMNSPAKQYKNRILAALPKAELDRLTPHLSSVTLELRAQLLDGVAEYAYFLEEGSRFGCLDSR
jgi:hypothetical protein